ncbi:cell division protein FtsA [Nitratifractor sp.]
MSKTILAIDVGSTKVAAVIAEVNAQNGVTITGHGVVESKGVKKGVITNIELASKSIKKALNDARRIAGNNISVATVSISNAYARSLNSSGIVNIPHKDISVKEIKRVMDTALYNANIPNEFEVIHVLPYNFKVDDQDFIEDPYGMNASRLEVSVNIIMTQKSALSNLTKAVRAAGLEIGGIVLNSYASAIAVMGDDERELGVAVIDMGGQTSNLIIHVGNSIRYNDFLAVGSNHITNDLSMALHTPLNVAEKVKIRHGNLLESSNESIELPVIGDEESRNPVPLETVHAIILARVEEALMLLAKSIDKSALREQIGAGAVLTGGMTKLKGMRELAQAIFGMPVRIGLPRELDGMYEEMKDPAFSTVVGLLLHQAGGHTQYEIDFGKNLLHHKEVSTSETLDDLQLGGRKEEGSSEEKEFSFDFNEPGKKEKKNRRSSRRGAEKNVEAEEEAFDFGDLPKPSKEEGGGLGKFVNWMKQLF